MVVVALYILLFETVNVAVVAVTPFFPSTLQLFCAVVDFLLTFLRLSTTTIAYHRRCGLIIVTTVLPPFFLLTC